jgi:hypothetical protein
MPLPPEKEVPTIIGQKAGNEVPPSSYTGNEHGACNPRVVTSGLFNEPTLFVDE